MSWLDSLRLRTRRLARPKEFERDLQEELALHLDLQIAEYVRRGMSLELARQEALRSFGGVAQVQEECRRVRAFEWLESALQDIRYGARVLLGNPGFTLVAVLTLALGIGANTAVFSVVHSVLLRPLPYRDAERIVMLWQANPEYGTEEDQVAPIDLHAWQGESRSFERFGFLANDSPGTRNFLLERDDGVQRFRGRFASAGLFDVLGVEPLMGRAIQEEEYAPGADRVVVLSHGFWQRSFGGDPQVLGRALRVPELRQGDCTVVGVMPPEFRFPDDCDVWFSFSSHPWHAPDRTVHDLWVIARLTPGVTLAAAQAEMDALQQRLAESHPNAPQVATHVRIVPLLDQFVGPRTRPVLWLLMATVGAVLLIACANVANLLLGRALARRREIAVRIAMGAHRARVIRQLLTESMMLAVLGGAAGVLIALAGIHWLPLMNVNTGGGVKEFRIDRFQDLEVDLSVLLFTLAVSIATSLVFGLVPALQTSRLDINASLKEEGRSSTDTPGRRRIRGALLVGQIAGAMLLVVWAGLLVRGFRRALDVPLGLHPESVLAATVDLDVARRTFTGSKQDITSQIMERALAVPGVKSAGAIGELPTARSGANYVLHIEGQPPVGGGELPPIDARSITPGYFETLGVPVLAGRDITAHDTLQSPLVALINETAARRYFPNRDPLGQRIVAAHPGYPVAHQAVREIVGVVGDVRMFGQGAEVQPEVYHSCHQFPPDAWGGSELTLPMLFRASGDPLRIVDDLRRAIENADGDQVLSDVRSLEVDVQATAAPQRFRTVLMSFLSGLALLLAAVGLYGVMSYAVSQRSREIGIRMALGSSPLGVLRLVIGYGVRLTVLGIVLGLIAAVAGGRVLSSVVLDIPPYDPVTLVVVTLVLLSVALLACAVPARRALAVEPMEALRHE
jgi:putative ABC transport system permease protein